MANELDAGGLIHLLKQWTIPTWNERVMQDSIETILNTDAVPYFRELALVNGVIDFQCGTVGVECKVDSAKGSVMRQLSKYSVDPGISELLLVTTQVSHRGLEGITLQGKPVRVYWISPL